MQFRKARIEDLLTLNNISIQSKKYWDYPDSWIKKWIKAMTLTKKGYCRTNNYNC